MSSTVPTGFKATLSKYASPFDKEVVIDDDKELWLIRIPDNLSEEDLVNMKIKVPAQKASKKALAKYEKDSERYALYKVPTEEDTEDGEPVDLGISGHEMVAFDCLVPSREDNGKLVFAPKKFDQYLILNQVVDIPDSTAYAQSVLDTPVYRRDQPKGLKMRFMPYGYYSGKENLYNLFYIHIYLVTNTFEIGQVTKDVEMVQEEPIEEEPKRKRVSEDDNETEKKKDTHTHTYIHILVEEWLDYNEFNRG
ncbi:DNA-directed RNA polymerase I, subunit RPA34.5 [Helicostylum pulchrum]|nr:DNA-directed RNA polymerase I, subunit RPA34.5 [Helicostylum pulchrum]